MSHIICKCEICWDSAGQACQLVPPFHEEEGGNQPPVDAHVSGVKVDNMVSNNDVSSLAEATVLRCFVS